MKDGADLARFQADPTQVRVSIRRHPFGWTVFVAPRGPGRGVIMRARDPIDAVRLAIETAYAAGMPGVDPFLQWAHVHPWGEAGVATYGGST